jgi:hypothetical protein
MRRGFVAAVVLLAVSVFAALAGPEQPTQNQLPNPGDFIPAGPHCKKRVNMAPWVGTPAVDWPKTYQCVLTYHTCHGPKTVRSSVRPGGTGMCDDYWAVHDALANREICCDQGERKEQKPEASRDGGG